MRKQRQKEKKVTETDSAAARRSCGEQADSTYQSKHTAGLPWEEANGGGATSLSLLAPSHHASQPACRQLHPSNLLLSTTFSRKTASHYPEQGVCADGQTPDQSAGFLVWHPLLLDPAYRGSTPRSVWHLNLQIIKYLTTKVVVMFCKVIWKKLVKSHTLLVSVKLLSY